MIVHIPLLLLLLVNAAPSDAALFSRSSESLTRAAKHVRRHVSKRSSGLLEDMRLAYAGLRQQQQPQVMLSSKLYCTNQMGTGLTGVGSGSNSSQDGSSGSGMDGSDGSSGSTTSSEPVAASSSDSVSPTATHTDPGSSPSQTGAAGPSSSSSSSSPSSQWKVAQQWVRFSSRFISSGNIDTAFSKGIRSSTDGTSSTRPIPGPMVSRSMSTNRPL